MHYSEIFQLAKRFAANRGYDIVKSAGEEDGWHYFAYSRPNLPRYGSLPSALRINNEGKLEELRSFIMRQKVNNRAFALENS